jgi:hypothetical protein
VGWVPFVGVACFGVDGSHGVVCVCGGLVAVAGVAGGLEVCGAVVVVVDDVVDFGGFVCAVFGVDAACVVVAVEDGAAYVGPVSG